MRKYRIRKLLQRLFCGSNSREIEPDEIFLDSSNLPQFDKNQFEGRIEKPIDKNTKSFVVVIFVFIIILYIIRVFLLQIYDGESFAYLSENNRLRHSIIFAERGVLYDRNGEELVWNEVGDSSQGIVSTDRSSSQGIVSTDQVVEQEKIYIEDKEGSFALRVYSDRDGLAHILGYVGYPLKDSSGNYYQDEFLAKDGAELFFDNRLSGVNGLEIEEIDALQEIKSKNTIRPPEDGQNITLSIDSRLNEALYRFLEYRANESGFVGGAGILMDVTSGEVITLTSFPEFSSQVLTDGEPRDKISSYITDERKPFLNRVVSGLYTPGSIVKPIVAIGALSEGVITPEKEILSTGSISLPHPYLEDVFSVFVDWKAHGYVNMREAIANSSNVYFYEVGGGFEDQEGIGIDGINKYARLFGLGKSTGSVFNDSDGTIPNPKWKSEMFDGEEWRIGDTYNTAIGQYGFQVTLIQMVRAIGAIANGGMLMSPILEKGENISYKSIQVDDSILQIVREGMRMGVEEGTVKSLNTPYVDVAAKTGTAQLGVSKKFVNSWVVGFFPYENPKYSFAIIMEKGPEKNLIGASSVMREFIKWINIYAPEYFNDVN